MGTIGVVLMSLAMIVSLFVCLQLDRKIRQMTRREILDILGTGEVSEVEIVSEIRRRNLRVSRSFILDILRDLSDAHLVSHRIEVGHGRVRYLYQACS